MPAYRIATLEKLKNDKSIVLSRSKAKRINDSLESSRKRYEKSLFDSFPYSYLESFRITIFGSGLFEEQDSEYFHFVTHLTKKLGKEMQVDIVTGGGGGLMLAANEGLEAAKAELKKEHRTIHCKNRGIRADLPHELGRNERLDVVEEYRNFSTRIEEFVRTSNGIYLAPGGIGTDLEASMFIQMKQRWKLEADFPILAHPFWRPIFEHENKIMFDDQIKKGHTPFITKDDLNIVHYTTDLDEIVKIFQKQYKAWEALRKKVKWVK